jgi:hypothetical protein
VNNKQVYTLVIPVLPDERANGRLADYVVQGHSISECWDRIDWFLNNPNISCEYRQRKKAGCYFANNIPQQYLDTIGTVGYLGVFTPGISDELLRKGFITTWFDIKLFLAGGYRESVGYYCDGEGQPALVLIAFPKWSKP